MCSRPCLTVSESAVEKKGAGPDVLWLRCTSLDHSTHVRGYNFWRDGTDIAGP